MCGVPRGWETLRPTPLARERLRHPLLFLLEDGVGAPPAACAARHAVCAADGADNDVNAAPASSNIPPPRHKAAFPTASQKQMRCPGLQSR